MTGLSRVSALRAAAGTAKLSANALAAIPTIQPNSVRRLLPGDAVLSDVEMCFMADKGLLVEEEQESEVETAGARRRTDNSSRLARDDGESSETREHEQQD